MEFELFDTDTLNMNFNDLSSLLDSLSNRENNMAMHGKPICDPALTGLKLENIEKGASLESSFASMNLESASFDSGYRNMKSESRNSETMWSPGGNSSSENVFPCSPPSRSYESSDVWSPSYHNSSSTSFSSTSSSNSPADKGAEGLNNSALWSPTHPSSPNVLNGNNHFSRPVSSSPPGLPNLANLGFGNGGNTNLNMKQTIQALNFLQELQESQSSPWNGTRSGEMALWTAALQQHLISHLMKQTPPTPPSPVSENVLRSPRMSRDNSGLSEPRCTWTGQLPPRNHKNPTYSCKVFLGGVPYEISISTLLRAFQPFGNVKIEWPGKQDNPPAPKGYAYLIYENERQVKALLQNCMYQYGKESNWYYKITSKRLRFHSKDIQVIPWAICDSNFVRCQTTKLDPQKTIFVGALHGMINAEALAFIMQELFGGVVYAGIDTDRHKYPIGSARVTFSNHKSYMKAVSAEFVEIRTSKFTKKVQVDPYLEDATCSICALQQGPYFCRSLSCFRYFCRTCFDMHHGSEALQSHRPLMRNASRQSGSSSSSSM